MSHSKGKMNNVLCLSATLEISIHLASKSTIAYPLSISSYAVGMGHFGGGISVEMRLLMNFKLHFGLTTVHILKVTIVIQVRFSNIFLVVIVICIRLHKLTE